MVLRFYNTLTRKKEEFKPLIEGQVKLYSCGPTVYSYVHIGNLRAAVFNDLLRRYLKYKGFKLTHVMNITDVDDKTIRDSQKEGKSLLEFTTFYTQEFLKDLKELNCETPEIMPKATDHIKEIVKLVLDLKEKGLAYKSESGSWYFKISGMKEYGRLANLNFEDLMENADGRLNSSDEYDKENARDFALWKSYSSDDGNIYWETELGKGRPGWHIECSAMSMKYLGKTFDIHTGGVDLIFPHHTNEIAQSEGCTGAKFVNYWMHNAHLIVNGEKMSKSLGNFFTLKDLRDKGYSSKAIRYELLRTHYRQQLDFREDELKQIPQTLQKFNDFLIKLDEISKPGELSSDISEKVKLVKQKFEESLDDDLNISGAIAAIFEFMTFVNTMIAASTLNLIEATFIKKTMLGFDSVMGVITEDKGSLSSDEETIIKEREQARSQKNWAKSDELRDLLKEKGIIVEDSNKGTRWKRVN
ncbi:cysteine--tRNA ligase [Candidatus Woesearchaeota archaeon]|jgi:cysteinyl-tRNA synthetase|nr:cysteine--tRNA ligase [Candidatus Woesearchaeota archaeon]